MLSNARTLRIVRSLVPIMLAALALGLVPSRSDAAQPVGDIQFIDNKQGEFSDGRLQRTSIGPGEVATIPEDQAGLVQLSPAGILNPWFTTDPLPLGLSNMGLAGLDKYLYVIAGETAEGKSDKVYRATINQRSGTPTIDPNTNLVWKEYILPGAKASQQGGCDAPTAARTRLSATAAPAAAAGRLGYLYVIGGVVDIANCENDITSTLVQIATVDSSGEITGWVSGPDLPTAGEETGFDTTFLGLADTMVTVVQTSANKRYLYVFGGLSVDPAFFLNPSTIYKTVFYAEIRASSTASEDGKLVHPTTGSTTAVWARAADMLFDDGLATRPGLRDGFATTATVSKVDNGVVTRKDGIFIAGGCFSEDDCNQRNPFIYRADINPTTGALTWDNKPGIDTAGAAKSVTIGQGRGGVGGIAYGNKLYIIGGTTSGLPAGAVDSVPTAFINDDLKLLPLGNGNDFIIGPTEKVLPGKRNDLSVALITALPPLNETGQTNVNAAWIYVAGGTDETNARKDTLIAGKVGGSDEAQLTKRTRDGWYYSSPIDITISGKQARVLSLRWTTAIDRSQNTQADIRVEFRKTITGDGRCRESDFVDSAPGTNPATDTNPDRWRGLDGSPTNSFRSISNSAAEPFNIVQMKDIFPNENIGATCLQYRAYFLQNGPNTLSASPNETASPQLLSFSLEKILDSNPDIKMTTDGTGKPTLRIDTLGGGVSNIFIEIQNLNERGLTNTLSVEEMVGPGSFYVNLCVVKDGELTLPKPPAPTPGTNPSCSKAYAQVMNNDMTAGRTLVLDQTTAWYDATTFQPIPDLRALFTQPGTYKVGVIIDYWDIIPEGEKGELNNRAETTTSPEGTIVTVTVTSAPRTGIFLPFVSR